MNDNIVVREQYRKGQETINYVVYKTKTGSGHDEVLQHKTHGRETAHITVHPGDRVYLRISIGKAALLAAVNSNMAGFRPAPSDAVKSFISRVRFRI